MVTIMNEREVETSDLVEIMNKKILKNSDNMLSFLKEKLTYDYPTIDLAIFNELFRDYFMGGNRVPPDRRQLIYDFWVNKAAGSVSSSVNIVDDKGIVLATVPPLLDMAEISSNNAGEFGLMMNMNELEAVNLPHIAEIKADRAIEQLHYEKAPLDVQPWIDFDRWLKGDESTIVVPEEEDMDDEDMDDVMNSLFGS